MDVRLALTGFGNVGQGVASLLAKHGERYEREAGARLLLTGVADRGGAAVAPDGLDAESLIRSKLARGTVAAAPDGRPDLGGADFVAAAQANVLIEAASTNFTDAEPGWSYVNAALAAGMDLVLASKGVLVLYYDELQSEVAKLGRRLLFAGAVGAPLPVLELADRVLVGTTITGFEGVVNATTNQILTLMAEGADYEDGVRAAQAAGIAETDPTLDVDGWDAAAKAAIISSAVFGCRLHLHQVGRTPLSAVAPAMLSDAYEARSVVKYIARITRTPGGVRATVGPEIRSDRDVLGRLTGAEMGLVYQTEELGPFATTVQEVGGVPTALSVLRDVFNLARDRGWTSR